MNKIKLGILASALIASSSAAVDVYDSEYEKNGSVSLIVKQGEVSKRVTGLFNRIYPNTRVIFKQRIDGYLPADIEVSGESRDVIAIEVLAGLGLSACYYENNIVEIGKFKRRGICPTAKTSTNQRPKVKRLGDGVMSFTDEWFGGFAPVGYEEQPQATAASYSSTPYINGASVATGVVEETKLDENGLPVKGTVVTTSAASDDVSTAQTLPMKVSFEFKTGQLLPQMRELVAKLDNSPKLVWKLDNNIQWFNDKLIEKPTFDEILASVLESYDAFADVHQNDVVVIRRAEGMQ